jgi:glycosyltransferase involved in cell wall biosynthesis
MLCHEVATHLTARGHRVSVLTSTYGPTGERDEPDVYRRLKLESDVYYYRPQQVLHYWVRKRSNLRAIEGLLAEMTPDAVVIWGMWNLSRLVAAWAEELAGSRVVYYLADVWPASPSEHEAYWDDATADSPVGKAFKRIFRVPVRLALQQEWRPYRLRFEHVIASSQFTRDELLNAGLPMDHCKVIYEGIDPVPYHKASEGRDLDRNGQLRVIFVGALAPHKGAHTAIEAFAYLAEGGAPPPIHLTILGAGYPEYEIHLHQLVQRWQLDDQVTFHRPIPRSQLPDFLAQFDVLVMPSVYKEPLARISQEAMAAGLVLVATLTGGTPEILVDGENGLAFEPEDAQGLAMHLQRLTQDADLCDRLVAAGWQTVTERFTISRMIDELEAYLAQVAVR